MKDVENVDIPPGATVFTAAGKTYFLYMGAVEMAALQREWGLVRAGVDTSAEWHKKLQQFSDRLKGGAMEDKLATIRHGLTRWARASGNGSGPVILDDEKVDELARNMDVPNDPRPHSFVIVNDLHERFYFDCFGYPELERGGAAPGPKAPKSQSRSTQSGS